MTSIALFEAENRLSELIERVLAGEEFVITRSSQPVARLSCAGRHDSAWRQQCSGAELVRARSAQFERRQVDARSAFEHLLRERLAQRGGVFEAVARAC